MDHFSQFGEDAWLVLNPPFSFDGTHTFCEVGAFDGVHGSNTLLFERTFGWRGVCIEPVPSNAAQCMANRSAVTWCCAAGYSGLKPFFMKPGDAGAGGLTVQGYAFPVVVCALEELVVASGFQNVDLLSIDTEGTELEVWETRGRLTPSIVIMEFWTQPNAPRDEEIIRQMTKDGYRVAHKTEANLIFTNV